MPDVKTDVLEQIVGFFLHSGNCICDRVRKWIEL